MLFDLNLMSLRLCLFDSVHSIIIGIKYELSEQLGEQRGYWILLSGFFNKIQFLTIHFMYTNVKNLNFILTLRQILNLITLMKNISKDTN